MVAQGDWKVLNMLGFFFQFWCSEYGSSGRLESSEHVFFFFLILMFRACFLQLWCSEYGCSKLPNNHDSCFFSGLRGPGTEVWLEIDRDRLRERGVSDPSAGVDQDPQDLLRDEGHSQATGPNHRWLQVCSWEWDWNRFDRALSTQRTLSQFQSLQIRRSTNFTLYDGFQCSNIVKGLVGYITARWYLSLWGTQPFIGWHPEVVLLTVVSHCRPKQNERQKKIPKNKKIVSERTLPCSFLEKNSDLWLHFFREIFVP